MIKLRNPRGTTRAPIRCVRAIGCWLWLMTGLTSTSSLWSAEPPNRGEHDPTAVIVTPSKRNRLEDSGLRLPPRTAPDSLAGDSTGRLPSARLDSQSASGRVGASTPVITVISSLAVVLGIFAALVWISRKGGRGTGMGRMLPDEAVQVLGQKPLSPGNSLMLLRCGHGLMLVGVSPAGMHPLGNITDEREVRHLEEICGGGRFVEAAEAWRALQPGTAARPAHREAPPSPPTRKRLFAEA